MAGRVRRKKLLAAIADPGLLDPPRCALCARPLGSRTEWHHLVPRSEGGRMTVPVHPICHRIIHATLGNKAIARDFSTVEALRTHPDIARFLAWIADKDPDFRAPTRRRRHSREA